jgi:polyphenol oxidase
VPEWPAPKNIHAVTTLRTGGVSAGVYTSFNLATHVGDDIDVVMQNRNLLKQRLGLPVEPVWLQQIHSDIVVDAAQTKSLVQADASYSHAANVVCCVMTADCLPVLVCSQNGTSVAAIHAGWRGLAAGIITKTINMLACEQPLVWLGPAIGAECFEVGIDVFDAFIANSSEFASAFKPHDGRYLADIYQLARIELAALGIHQVYGGGLCTMTDERFYSYRRDKDTGRMATLIWRE